ncbi:MAG: type I phosphomannose isomerase catalytic subunit [Phototrophicaceae bacterium]|jgi:mannose-6-phosphate isomerase
MAEALYPLLLNAALKTRVWGGRKLETVMGKTLPTAEPYGESWELHDSATVANGVLAGRSVGELVAEYGSALIGEANNPADGFPLLAKFLDAADWLSIQVHPNDVQAQRLEGQPRGKTEAWVVLQTEPNAKMIIGLQPNTSRETLADAIRSGALEPYLVYAEVRAGDVLLLEANTVHALGPGLLIYEIQQSSDVTYRLYDWNRMGLDGKPREMHLDKGLEVANLTYLPTVQHPEQTLPEFAVVESHYFKTTHCHLDETVLTFRGEGRFHVLTCVNGQVNVMATTGEVAFGVGQTVLIPANISSYQLSGRGDVLRSWQP